MEKAQPAQRSPEMYGIYRLATGRGSSRGWFVSIVRKGKCIRRYFPDARYSSREQALEASKRHRDELLAEKPMMSRADYASIRRRNNQSGIPGVCRTVKTSRNGRGTAYWIAFWPKHTGGSFQAKFSTDQYGEEAAFRLAVQARQQALARMSTPYVNSQVHRVVLGAE